MPGLLGIFSKKKTDFKKLVEEGALVLDVRTKAEYAAGHIKGSRNIPLDQLGGVIQELKKKNKPVITCCRSGMRSGMAASTLRNAGLEVYNGGPWDSLNRKIN